MQGRPLPRSQPRSLLCATESDIRAALLRRLEGERSTGALIVHELGILQGSSRVDVAVLNGELHGYEIKSDHDTLARLPGQVEAYSRVLSHVTLVTATRHYEAATALVPSWWGVAVARHETRGLSIAIRSRPRRNPSIDRSALVQLLWRDETLAILRELRADRGIGGKPRRDLWAALSTTVSTEVLAKYVCTTLKLRQQWRDPRHAWATQRGEAGGPRG